MIEISFCKNDGRFIESALDIVNIGTRPITKRVGVSDGCAGQSFLNLLLIFDFGRVRFNVNKFLYNGH